MSDDGSVLSQAEIDALFRQATGTSIARPSAAATAPPSSAAPASVPAAAAASVPLPAPISVQPPKPTVNPSPAVSQVNVQKPSIPAPAHASGPPEAIRGRSPEVVELTAALNEQKAQTEALKKRIANLEAHLAELSQGGSSSISARQVGEFTLAVRKLTKQTGAIQKGLEATPAYNLGEEFSCSECGTHGRLAIPVTCTGCGKEGWWGWWPEEGT